MCINAAVTVGCLIYLGWLSWVVLLMVLGFMAIGIVTYQLPLLKATRYLRDAREDEDTMFKSFHALTDGAKELKLHQERRNAFISELLEPVAKRFRKKVIIALTTFTAAASWGQILFFVLIGLILFLVPRFQSVSENTLVGYTIVLLYMMSPLQVILNALPGLGRANISLQKVESLGLSFAGESYKAPAKAPALNSLAWRRLELKGVTHVYHREDDDSSFTLGPIDLCFRPGELVFLIGGNGSGKTTLAKLLVGLYTPEAGEVRLDERVITDESRDGYRQSFSVVFSDFYLFDRLLGLNKPDLDLRARDFVARLQLSNKVSVQNGALSTTELSQGQRKRLALLTAYLEDRPIYVFDEWAADQDPVFRDIFYYELLPHLKAKGKTVIVISHDDRYYHLGDRLIKLDYGQVEYDKDLTPQREESTQVAVS
jgi:putative ATP-binding cassette transporter